MLGFLPTSDELSFRWLSGLTKAERISLVWPVAWHQSINGWLIPQLWLWLCKLGYPTFSARMLGLAVIVFIGVFSK